MNDNAGKYFILNKCMEPATKLDNVTVPSQNVAYEVIRVINGVPLFFEDHYTRMQNSMRSVSAELETESKSLIDQISLLVKANGSLNSNVKVIAYMNNGIQNMLLYKSKSYYPGTEEVKKGVPVGVMHFERNNPNAKIVNNAYKAEAARRIEEGSYFEVLLVNGKNEITEGSKSNVFFIAGNKVITSPSSYVLKGITREYILKACRQLKLDIVEKLINLDELDKIDGLFISGTSIKVLPVCSVENKMFNSSVNPVIVSIRDRFDGIINDYIDSKRA
jgi:branched-chain amino acid aminotransferase